MEVIALSTKGLNNRVGFKPGKFPARKALHKLRG
jgi:hypothetical protein